MPNKYGPSIFGRFGITFLILVALPSLLGMYLFSQMTLSALHMSASSQARDSGIQILRYLSAEVDGVSYQTGALIYDQEIKAGVSRYILSKDPISRFLASSLVDRPIVNLFNYTNKAGIVGLLMKDGSWYSYGNIPNLGLPAYDRAKILSLAVGHRGRVVFLDDLAGPKTSRESGNFLTAFIAPGTDEPNPELKMALLTIRIPFLDELKNSGFQRTKTETVLIGRNHQILFSTLDPATSALLLSYSGPGIVPDERTLSLNGKIWLTAGQQLESTGWILLTLRNEAEITGKIQGYEQLLILGLLILGTLFLIYAAAFFSRIASPIQAVVQHMDLVGEGAWGVRIPTGGLKELGILVDSFNRMSKEIVRLNKERLGLELDALRYQINPHFVANTLNAIRLMAQSARMKGLQEMAGDLMVMLADSYSGGQSLTDLASELHNIECYVRIMKVRFSGRFDLRIDSMGELGGALTLRMILQPLVENAVIHGVADLDRRGKILIRARLVPSRSGDPSPVPVEQGVERKAGSDLVIEVIDNGVGMDPGLATEKRTDPLGAQDRFARVGMANIDRRIKLHFGDSFGLEVTSSVGHYTKVMLRIPALQRTDHA